MIVWLVILILFGLADLADAMNCPNRPAGSTLVANVHFNTTDGEGQLFETYPGAGYISHPAGAEGGNAGTSTLARGAITGGQQTGWPRPETAQPISNLYFCIRFQAAPGFVGIRTANKVWFLMDLNWTYGTPRTVGFFGLARRDGNNYPTNTGFYFYFGHNTGGLRNGHACGGDEFGLACNPNVQSTTIMPGTWYTFEAYGIASSCDTCQNGTIKWWVDGALNGNYPNLNYGGGVLNEFQINHTWDGSFALQCHSGPPLNSTIPRDCTNDQTYYFDELQLASIGGLPGGSGGTGGGTTPPPPPSTPPPPPPLPPNMPSNLRVN